MNILEIYRIEHNDNEHGMWYDEKGVFKPFILSLTEGISAHLPMDADIRYGANDTRWYSACHSLELLLTWFSPRDIYELEQAGFGLYKFKVKEFVIEEFQTLFTREGVINKESLSLHDYFDLSQFVARM